MKLNQFARRKFPKPINDFSICLQFFEKVITMNIDKKRRIIKKEIKIFWK
jgi:hypothetical protein